MRLDQKVFRIVKAHETGAFLPTETTASLMRLFRNAEKDARGSAPSSCHRAEANEGGQTISPVIEADNHGAETKHSDLPASSGRNRSVEERSDEEATANVSKQSGEATSWKDYAAVMDTAVWVADQGKHRSWGKEDIAEAFQSEIKGDGYILSRISGSAASELRPDDSKVSGE